MDQKITTVIVDDEHLARKRLCRLLESREEIEVAAVCKNGKEAIEQIGKRKPTLIFLDIQMPEVDGFDVLKSIEDDNYYPNIIFVTAYDEYAMRAFEVHALDYLLKPFDEDKFYESLDRAVDIIRQASTRQVWEKLDAMSSSLNGSKDYLSRIMIKDSERIFFLPVEEIDWIESAGNYVQIHTPDDSYLLRETMINMEEKLNPDVFFRVHRSTIINLNKVKELEQWFHGDYQITMKNGKKLTLSRNYKELLQRF